MDRAETTLDSLLRLARDHALAAHALAEQARKLSLRDNDLAHDVKIIGWHAEYAAHHARLAQQRVDYLAKAPSDYHEKPQDAS